MGPAEADLMRFGDREFVAAVHTIASDFSAEHRLELNTLWEDVTGDFRQGGPIRLLSFLIVIPSALPLGVHLHYQLVGRGLEWLGMVAAVLCAVLMGVIAVRLRGRPLDRSSLGIHTWVACSCAAGAAIAWWIGVEPSMLLPYAGAVVVVLLLLVLLGVGRRRHLTVARLRDEEAMDRADSLRSELSARLRSRVRPSTGGSEQELFVQEVVQRIVPRPERRLYAETPAPH